MIFQHTIDDNTNPSNILSETEKSNALSIVKPIGHFDIDSDNPFQSYNTMIECYKLFFKFHAKKHIEN